MDGYVLADLIYWLRVKAIQFDWLLNLMKVFRVIKFWSVQDRLLLQKLNCKLVPDVM